MEHKFICYKRFKGKGVNGEFNIKRGTELLTDDRFIYAEGNCYTGRTLCAIRSEVGCNHFAINDDGLGMERSQLTSGIINRLSKRDDNYQKRWDKIWSDPISNTMRRKEYEDMWLWDVPFYQASIEDLKHILGLIEEVKDV